MTKSEARKKYRALRSKLTAAEISEASRQICEQLKQLESTFQTVHVFLPIEKLKEINLWDFIEYCYAKKKTVCTSVSDFKTHEMKTVIISKDTEFKENAWGIPEPVNGKELSEKEIDLVIVPLLYADSQGNRVGYGKGFYDRFLANCNAEVQKIGVNYFSAKELIEDSQITDIRIDELITFTDS